MIYLFTYDLRRADDRLAQFVQTIIDEELGEMNFTPIQITELNERIMRRIAGAGFARYNHPEINARVIALIAERNWQIHQIELRTSFLFDAPEMTIEEMRQIFIEAGIIDELIVRTDNYLFVKITDDANYYLN